MSAGERPARDGERAVPAPAPTAAAAPGPPDVEGAVLRTAVARPGLADGETDNTVPPTSTLSTDPR